MSHPRILEAIQVLQALGLPKAHQNARDGLALLALLRVTPYRDWSEAFNPLLHVSSVAVFPEVYDIRPRADAAAILRSQTLPAFAAAGIVVLNPDVPGRSAKSLQTMYRIPYPVLTRLQALGAQAR